MSTGIFPGLPPSISGNQSCAQPGCSHDPYGMLLYSQILPSPSSPPPLYSNATLLKNSSSVPHSPPPSYSLYSSLERYPYQKITGAAGFRNLNQRIIERYVSQNDNLSAATFVGKTVTSTDDRCFSDDSDEITNATSEIARLSEQNFSAVTHFTRDPSVQVKHSRSSCENGFLSSLESSENRNFMQLHALPNGNLPDSNHYHRSSLSPSIQSVSSAQPSNIQNGNADNEYNPSPDVPSSSAVWTRWRDHTCMMYPTPGVPSYSWPHWFSGGIQTRGPQGSSSEEADHQIQVRRI